MCLLGRLFTREQTNSESRGVSLSKKAHENFRISKCRYNTLGLWDFLARISVDFTGYFWQDFMDFDMDFDRDFDSISKGILNILREISRILVIL